jgi:hypothetical protein
MSISCPSGHILETKEMWEVADCAGPVSKLTDRSDREGVVTE